MLAWRCTALASELARSTQTTSAMLATRPLRSAHVRSPCRCEFMLLRRAIGCCSTLELASLDFFLTSPISPSSRMLLSNALALFVLKSLTADGLTGARNRVGAESAGSAAQTSTSRPAADFVCHPDRTGTRTYSPSPRRAPIRQRTPPSRRSRPPRAGRAPRPPITVMPAMPTHDPDPCPHTSSARAHARARVHAHARVLPHAHAHARAHAHSHVHTHILYHPHALAAPP